MRAGRAARCCYRRWVAAGEASAPLPPEAVSSDGSLPNESLKNRHPQASGEVVVTAGPTWELSAYVEDAAGLAPELLRILGREGAAPTALSIKQPIPEDVYP
jgi:hypothetical protein